MNKKLLLCIATEKGYAVLKSVHQSNMDIDLYVSTYEETSVIEKFNKNILDYSSKNNLTIVDWKDIRKSKSWLADNNIWAIVCVGWKYLVSEEMANDVEGRVIVTHDSLLPRYRGYAPLATALINGEETVGVSVIIANNEVDAGDILYQKEISVQQGDTVNDLIKKLLPFFSEGILSTLKKMMGGNLLRIPQNNNEATYSIWRSEDDLWIDWLQPAEVIERSIRALGLPYMGARTKLENEIIIIKSAMVVPDIKFEIRQAGKVWRLDEKGRPVVICGEGMLLITDAEIEKKPLIPMKRLRVKFN
jgi:methionyl-tRNA formyltransferase